MYARTYRHGCKDNNKKKFTVYFWFSFEVPMNLVHLNNIKLKRTRVQHYVRLKEKKIYTHILYTAVLSNMVGGNE